MNNTLIFNFMKPGKGAELKIEYLLNYYKEHNIRILRNVYIPISDNKTTAIDVLMIHPLGIFVFESKDYSEWIYGNENANQWTQTLVGNGKSYKNHFYNPIKQNEGHIKVLKKYIGEVNTFSFVVFTNACEFKNITRTNNITYLIHCRELNKTLDSIFRDNPSRIISNKDIEILYDLLLCFSIRVSNDKNML